MLRKGTSVFSKRKTDWDVSLKVCSRVINGFWLLIIERERAQKGASKKTHPLSNFMSDTWGSHFQESLGSFWGPLSLFSLARRPCYSISIVCMLRSAQLDCIGFSSLLYKNKLRLFGRAYFQILAYLLSVFQYLNLVT